MEYIREQNITLKKIKFTGKNNILLDINLNTVGLKLTRAAQM